MRRKLAAIVVLGLVISLKGAPVPAPAHIDVTVHEGTSMSVAVSPDGRTLAVDLQGSIWTLPAAGGAATRITDIFNDARQPAFSPDGKWIAFFAYRDGGYDLWAIAPDGSNQHKLTWGAFDDREPAWSHDGTRVAFSSDRGNPLGSDYNIWIARHAQRRAPPADEESRRRLHADLVARRQGNRLRLDARGRPVGVGGERRRRHRAQGGERGGARRRAVVGRRRPARLSRDHRRRPRRRWRWTRVVALRDRRQDASPAAKTCSRSARRGPSPSEFYYVSDGKIRKRGVDGGAPQTIEFSATMQVTRAANDLHADASATSRRSRRARCSASSARCSRPTASRSPLPRSATST